MKNKFRIALLSMAVVGLVGCADKLTDEIVNQSPEDIGGETGYISFRIKSADTGGMTRGWLNDPDGEYPDGYFAEGEGASGNFAPENAIVENIQANRVFFFNADGTYHSSSLLSLTKKEGNSHNGDNDHKDEEGTSTYPENVYTATVKRTSDRGEQIWPTQCLVILNGRPSRLNALLALAQAGKPADENKGSFDMPEFLSWINKDFRDTDAAEEGLTLGLYRVKNDKKVENTDPDSLYYFTMSNSVYYDDYDVVKKNGDDEEIVKRKGAYNATQIKKENLQMTSEEAAKNPITVYVERIMSKVEVDFTGYDKTTGDETTKATETGYITEETEFGYIYSFTEKAEQESEWLGPEEDKKTTITLKALITNWTINAVEYQTKLFKDIDFDKKGDDATWNETVPFEGWNDVPHHRSYWARDINYLWNEGKGEDDKGYPTQYRNAFDNTANSYQMKLPSDWTYGMGTKEKAGNDIFDENYPWALDYKSFNAVTNKRKYKYCLENTFDAGIKDNAYRNMIMGSHLLVEGRLMTAAEADSLTNKTVRTETSKAFDFTDISDKYYYSSRYYDEKTYINRQLAVIDAALTENIDFSVDNLKIWGDDDDGNDKNFEFKDILGGLWVKDNNGKYKRVVIEVGKNEDGTLKDNCQIAAADVFTIAPAYVVKGDGKVTIALKGADSDHPYGYENEAVNLYYLPYKSVGEDGQPLTFNDKNGNGQKDDGEEDNEIHQFTRNELVSFIYQVTNIADCFKNGMMYYAVPIQHHAATGKADGDYEIDYDNIKTGDYGVVRNHWYKFTISAIAKPGIPVHDPDQPIIPNYDDTDRYIGFEVVILPWHIVDNGNVTLGKE